jgi:hypothetical protein
MHAAGGVPIAAAVTGGFAVGAAGGRLRDGSLYAPARAVPEPLARAISHRAAISHPDFRIYPAFRIYRRRP